MGPVDAWIARTHGFIGFPSDLWGTLDPSHPRSHGMVHRSVVDQFECRLPLKGSDLGLELSRVDMDPLGFEPRASSLQRRHSPTELWARSPDGEAAAYVLASVVLWCPVGCVERGRRLDLAAVSSPKWRVSVCRR